MAAADDVSLYERIGGAAAVDEMVDAFYLRVLGDPELRPFFDGVSIERLRKMQKEFFAAALDGPVSTSDTDLARAHQHLAITRHHVTRFVRHLIDVLDEHALIHRRDAMEIIYRIGTYTDEVVGDAGGTDG